MKNLTGAGVALITPFHNDKSVDYDALSNLIEYNIENGIDYFVVLGTTAEAATLSKQEKQQVVKHIIKVNNKRLPLVLGIGGNDTASLRAEIEQTDTSDFDAILSVSPFYNKPNQQGLYEHYKELAQTGKNIIIYNVPSRTGQNLEAETTVRLAKEFPNLIMIKEACSNFNQYLDILRLKPTNFSLVSGDDEYATSVILAGADGVISVVGQAFPKLFSQMIRLALEKKAEEAYAIHNKLVQITRLIFSEGNPCGLKEVLTQKGIIKNNLRLPLVKASDALSEKIRIALQELE